MLTRLGDVPISGLFRDGCQCWIRRLGPAAIGIYRSLIVMDTPCSPRISSISFWNRDEAGCNYALWEAGVEHDWDNGTLVEYDPLTEALDMRFRNGMD